MFNFNAPARKTVDSILSAFHNTVAELEAAATHHAAEAEAHVQAIAALAEKKLDAETESARASGIAAKMRAVFA